MHTVASSLASSMERVSGTDRHSGSQEHTDASHRTLLPVAISLALGGGGGVERTTASQHSFHTMRVCHAIESIHASCAYLVVLYKSWDRDICRVLIMADIESWPKYFRDCVCANQNACKFLFASRIKQSSHPNESEHALFVQTYVVRPTPSPFRQ